MALIDCRFHSDVLGVQTAMTVILPQAASTAIGVAGSAAARRDAAWPGHKTLWLLHGMSDDHTIWTRRTSVERYVGPLNLAVVMPAVNRSYYADMKHGPRYFEFVGEELPRLAREFFPLSERREDNFVAGLSMGGYGAFKLALTHPQRYAAAASLSGAVDPAGLAEAMTDRRDEFINMFGDVTRIKGSANDLSALAEAVALEGRPCPKLYQCCGTSDFLHEQNVRYRDHLRSLKLPLTYDEGPGDHNWAYWDRTIQDVLAWLPRREVNP